MPSVDLGAARAVAHAVAAEWGLTLGEPFALANYSWVAPAGEDAVLKVAWQGDDESLHEAEALELWGGDGAVRLLRSDPSRRALLEERAVPGTDLSALAEADALAVAVDVGRRLWRPAGAAFRRVADQVPGWLDAGARAGRPGSELVPLARELLTRLGDDRSVLIHGDFHHHNILRHGDRYSAIDPKPMLGQPEYDIPSYLRNPLGHRLVDRDLTERRIAAFVAAGLDDWRIRAWTVIRLSYLGADPDEAALVRDLI